MIAVCSKQRSTIELSVVTAVYLRRVVKCVLLPAGVFGTAEAAEDDEFDAPESVVDRLGTDDEVERRRQG